MAHASVMANGQGQLRRRKGQLRASEKGSTLWLEMREECEGGVVRCAYVWEEEGGRRRGVSWPVCVVCGMCRAMRVLVARTRNTSDRKVKTALTISTNFAGRSPIVVCVLLTRDGVLSFFFEDRNKNQMERSVRVLSCLLT